MEHEFILDGQGQKLSLEQVKGHLRILSPGEPLELDVRRLSDNGLSILAGGRSYEIYFARDKNKLFIWVDGELFLVEEPSQDAGRRGRAEETAKGGVWRIAAPMPGKVIKFNVAEGDRVRKNQTLAVVEAMKMENEIKSPGEGTVKKLHAAPGDIVDTNKPLLEIESA